MIDYYEPNSPNQKHFLYMFPVGEVKCTLRKRYPYSELFWSAFSPHFPAFRLNMEWENQESRKIREKCRPE